MAADQANPDIAGKSAAVYQLSGRRDVVTDKDRDAALVAESLRGSRKAMGELVGLYEKPVFNAAYRILGNPQDAADVTQSVFLKVFENLEKYDPQHKFFSWIYRIAVNESISFRKQQTPRPVHDETAAAVAPEAERAISEEAIGRQVQEALMRLSDEQRILVALKHFSELSYRDISAVLDIPEKTVKSRLYSARQQLKKDLAVRGVRPE